MQLSQDELTLYLQCLNEVLRGFSAKNFEQKLGVLESELVEEDGNLREIERASRKGSPIPNVRIRPEVIRATMEELGESEFQTRTGFELYESEALLRRTNRICDRRVPGAHSCSLFA
jgi:hypothetical protein